MQEVSEELSFYFGTKSASVMFIGMHSGDYEVGSSAYLMHAIGCVGIKWFAQFPGGHTNLSYQNEYDIESQVLIWDLLKLSGPTITVGN